LHDCWSFLSKIYPSHCPIPNKNEESQIIKFWKGLKSKPSKFPLSAVTPSNWMNQQCSNSSWNDYEVKTIHNPVPEWYFKPLDRDSCKQALGLSLEKPVILAIAGNLSEERKGGVLLNEILKSSLTESAQFLIIGGGVNLQEEKIKSLGYIQDEITLRISYHAADILLHPAKVDNLPNTVAESMSCGTPVLAFPTGGLAEMIIPNESGWLAKSLKKESLVKSLSLLIENKSYEGLRQSTKKNAYHMFNQQEIAVEYFKMFESQVSQ